MAEDAPTLFDEAQEAVVAPFDPHAVGDQVVPPTRPFITQELRAERGVRNRDADLADEQKGTDPYLPETGNDFVPADTLARVRAQIAAKKPTEPSMEDRLIEAKRATIQADIERNKHNAS